jgi:DNA primase
VDFYFGVVAAGEDLGSARGKGLAVAELAPLIAELGDEIERQHYVQRLSRLVQVDEITIAGRVQAAARTQQASAERQRQERPVAGGRDEKPPTIMGDNGAQPGVLPAGLIKASTSSLPTSRVDYEDHLLASLINEGNLLVWLSSATERLNIQPPTAEDWQESENREIFLALKRYLAGDEPWDIELFQDTLPTGLHGRLAHLLAYAARVPQDNPLLQREDAAKVLVRMRIERLKQETINIKYLLADMQSAGEQEAVRSFFRINNQHLRELSHLQQVMARLSLALSQRASSEKGLKIN